MVSELAVDSVETSTPAVPSTESVPTLVCFADGEAIATTADGFQGTEAVVAFLERNAPDRVESVAEW